ncbi:MAG: response regulator transcription factor [Acidaminococcaceae bacterium]|jgi:DNA-binding response OmpR family regulator|nr:response regulator transcription factor [Acidaminococcaceae bacterium]MCI2110161.1 response regulator transcription factor [Acidaminococcaceae bacterium]
MEKQQKVLVADDEAQIRNILSIYLKKAGFEVVEAADGAEALVKVQSDKPDIIVLDIMMPVMDGLEVCKQVRKISDIPIIMLTAKDEDDDRILGLEIGADDYITKPFNTREVVARVNAVLRRSGQTIAATGKQVLEFPDLMINLSEYRVVAFGKEVTFTAKEMELLWCLASHPGIVFSRNQLLETIWGYTYYGDTRTVDTHIKRVRHKLNIPKDSKWDILTVWGVGYKFEVKK